MPGGRVSASRGGLRFRRGSPQRSPPQRGSPAAAAPAGPGDAASPAGDTPRTFDAPSFDALVRKAYYSHVSSQILVSNLPPWVRGAPQRRQSVLFPSPMR